jgi:hypothetical protein
MLFVPFIGEEDSMYWNELSNLQKASVVENVALGPIYLGNWEFQKEPTQISAGVFCEAC